ncbi:unnamed protein product [Trichogramma brassicae]|uniref:Uncharacterized protein n=1 Tax=Trichogramma brassicae TaxID=86971 RepID=A0A6H5IKE8_9HYME|nr:unnamed protein product [Trichogramma brassicae]
MNVAHECLFEKLLDPAIIGQLTFRYIYSKRLCIVALASVLDQKPPASTSNATLINPSNNASSSYTYRNLSIAAPSLLLCCCAWDFFPFEPTKEIARLFFVVGVAATARHSTSRLGIKRVQLTSKKLQQQQQQRRHAGDACGVVPQCFAAPPVGARHAGPLSRCRPLRRAAQRGTVRLYPNAELSARACLTAPFARQCRAENKYSKIYISFSSIISPSFLPAHLPASLVPRLVDGRTRRVATSVWTRRPPNYSKESYTGSTTSTYFHNARLSVYSFIARVCPRCVSSIGAEKHSHTYVCTCREKRYTMCYRRVPVYTAAGGAPIILRAAAGRPMPGNKLYVSIAPLLNQFHLSKYCRAIVNRAAARRSIRVYNGKDVEPRVLAAARDPWLAIISRSRVTPLSSRASLRAAPYYKYRRLHGRIWILVVERVHPSCNRCELFASLRALYIYIAIYIIFVSIVILTIDEDKSNEIRDRNYILQRCSAAAAEERKQEQLAAPAAALITDEPCFNRPTTTSYIYITCAKQMRKIVSGASRTPTRPSTAGKEFYYKTFETPRIRIDEKMHSKSCVFSYTRAEDNRDFRTSGNVTYIEFSITAAAAAATQHLARDTYALNLCAGFARSMKKKLVCSRNPCSNPGNSSMIYARAQFQKHNSGSFYMPRTYTFINHRFARCSCLTGTLSFFSFEDLCALQAAMGL